MLSPEMRKNQIIWEKNNKNEFLTVKSMNKGKTEYVSGSLTLWTDKN